MTNDIVYHPNSLSRLNVVSDDMVLDICDLPLIPSAFSFLTVGFTAHNNEVVVLSVLIYIDSEYQANGSLFGSIIPSISGSLFLTGSAGVVGAEVSVLSSTALTIRSKSIPFSCSHRISYLNIYALVDVLYLTIVRLSASRASQEKRVVSMDPIYAL